MAQLVFRVPPIKQYTELFSLDGVIEYTCILPDPHPGHQCPGIIRVNKKLVTKKKLTGPVPNSS